jgi:hypothetical protein
MVSEKDVACLAVETLVSFATRFVLRALSSKSEIHRDTLPGDGGRTSRVMTGGTFFQFRWKTGGTLIQNGFARRELWNAVNVLVGMGEIGVNGMAEARVPKKTFGANAELEKMKVLKRLIGSRLVMRMHGSNVSRGECGSRRFVGRGERRTGHRTRQEKKERYNKIRRRGCHGW